MGSDRALLSGHREKFNTDPHRLIHVLAFQYAPGTTDDIGHG